MPALSTTAKREYYAELGNSLPLPVLDEPEYRQRRHATAVETFEALRPGDAYEARLAVKIVLCGALAVENLREANVHRDDFPKRMRCLARAAGMMREERASRRVLAQEQKVRLAVEAVAGNAPAQPGGASAPLPPDLRPDRKAAPPPVQAAPVPPPPAPASPKHPPRHAATTQAAAPPESEPPSPEALAMAKTFIEDNLVIAAQIRHDRGVTPQNKAYFRNQRLPSDPVLIDALIRGTGDLFTLLDEAGAEMLDEAA